MKIFPAASAARSTGRLNLAAVPVPFSKPPWLPPQYLSLGIQNLPTVFRCPYRSSIDKLSTAIVAGNVIFNNPFEYFGIFIYGM